MQPIEIPESAVRATLETLIICVSDRNEMEGWFDIAKGSGFFLCRMCGLKVPMFFVPTAPTPWLISSDDRPDHPYTVKTERIIAGDWSADVRRMLPITDI